MRLVFLGSGEFALPTLRWLVQSEHHVAMVITQPSRPSGRGRHTTPTPVKRLAGELGLPVMEVENVNDPSIVGHVRSQDARLGLVIAFGQKLGRELCRFTPEGFINLHASLLPKYRGAAPINWAIVRGEDRTGCTVFRIVERMDAGPTLVSRATPIKPDETAGELHDRLAGIGVEAVQAALELFIDDASPPGTPQDESLATTAPKLKKSDGFVRFDKPAAEIVRRVLGMTPWPGAGCIFEAPDGRWERVNLVRVRVAEAFPLAKGGTQGSLPPGTIDERRYAAAADALLEILELQPSSKRVMSWQEYVNGRHVRPGDRFVTPGP